MLTKLVCIFFFLLFSWSIHSQDSLSFISEIIEIEASSYSSDTLNLNTNSVLNQLDQSSKGVHQTNGPGLLSTFLIRGLAARHTGIIWNDWSIQSAVNSTYDLSLIPNIFYNMELNMGSSSSGFGNGAFAGVIQLKPNIHAGETFSFSSQLSSIGNSNLASSANFKLKNTNLKFGIESTNQNNHYRYLFNRKERTQENADFENHQSFVDLQHQLNVKNKIGINVWHQLAHRSIAPSKTSSYNNDQQKDKNTRVNFFYQNILNTASHKFSLAYFNENLRYRSNQISESLATSKVYLARQMSRYFFSSNTVLTQIFDLRLDNTEANFFETIRKQENLGFAIHFSKENLWKQINIKSKLRADYNSISSFQLSYNLQLERAFHDKLKLHFNTGRSFQNPSYNDLYWPEGGNPSLKTEVIYDNEIGMEYQVSDFSFITNVFYNYVDNWIQWSPQDNNLWSPSNIAKVNSYGFESLLSFQRSFKKSSISSKLSYSFVRSIILEHKAFDDLIGNQMIYIPNHTINGLINTNFFNFHMEGEFSWIGSRYITRDNLNSLDDYTLINAKFYFENSIEKGSLWQIGTFCKNLMNVDYEVVNFYAMPLRYFGIFVNYKFS